ncbi:MAG: glycosyltransferase [Candidatus Micrarchaeia archaeon]
MDASVIVPTFNEEKMIMKCLLSIRRQETALEYEVLVSDSNSTDKTLAIAEKYADKVIKLKERGIYLGRNEGVKHARGKVLIFIDADTTIPPNYLDAVCAVIRDREISALSCAFKFDASTPMLRWIEEASNKYLLFKGSLGKGELLGFNCVMRRDTFMRAGGFPPLPLEDGAFAKKLTNYGRVVYLPEPRVVTSARRLQKSGAVSTVAYYASLGVLTSFPNIPIKRLMKYRGYIPQR